MLCKICNSQNTGISFISANTHGRYVFDPLAGFEVYHCQSCGVFFLGGITVNSEYYARYYLPDYYSSGVSGGLLNRALESFGKMVIHFKQSEILRYFKRSDNAKLKILDVGCGSGEFLANISPDIFDKYGLEINPQGYEQCRRKQLKVVNKDIREAGFAPESFDVITMWHVLEHSDQPYELLKEARRILKGSGIIIVATPNTDSLGFRHGGKGWFHLDSPRHLILYNRHSLGFTLSKAGFRVENFKNIFYDFPLDLFWSLRKSGYKYLAYPLYPLFKFISGETFLAVARKDWLKKTISINEVINE